MMMKKRLLALALCLVMVSSLLPMIAYGDNPDFGVSITGTGFVISDGSGYALTGDELTVYMFGQTVSSFTGVSQGLYQDKDAVTPITNELVDGETYFFKYKICSDSPEEVLTLYTNLQTNGCFLTIPDYTTSCSDIKSEISGEFGSIYIVFQMTKDHDWKFTVSENHDTLTAQCQNQECRREVSVSLKADSVTLPESPFNARLEGWEAFKKAVPSATYNPNSFDYKLNGEPVTDKSNPKAGNYQAGVLISGLPSPVEYSGVAARANMDGNGYSAYLYTQYTAVDPAITAQTGDNRPIELMMGSVVVFSALAAAAFIVDSKRRLQQ